MKAYQIGPGRIMVWRYPALNTKCRHFLNNIQLWLNYIELMIWLSTQRIYILDNTTILDICSHSHSSCFVYYSPELLPSRDPSTNRKMTEKDRTFSRFALSFYSYYASAVTVSSPGTICQWLCGEQHHKTTEPKFPIKSIGGFTVTKTDKRLKKFYWWFFGDFDWQLT